MNLFGTRGVQCHPSEQLPCDGDAGFMIMLESESWILSRRAAAAAP
ncbi:MAG TPA: hypothetical protein VH414_00155 [Lichenihabitans sp.]|jgi:hypothetical protein|nr:hypothetical protein [Lichenihabitans sp.]